MNKSTSSGSGSTASNGKNMDFFWLNNKINIEEILAKKELEEKYYYSFIHIENLDTYYEPIITIIGISIFSYFYTWGSLAIWVAPILILISSVFILALTLHSVIRHRLAIKFAKQKNIFIKDKLNANVAGYIWLFWLVYGIIFKDVTIWFVTKPISYLLGALAFLFVLYSYRPRVLHYSLKSLSVILAGELLLLLVPHSDSLSYDMDPITVLFKLVIFFVLYISTDFELKLAEIINTGMMSSVETHNNSSSRKQEIIENDILNRLFFVLKKTVLIVIRTIWILLAPRYLMFLVIIQLFPLYNQLKLIYLIYHKFKKILKEKGTRKTTQQTVKHHQQQPILDPKTVDDFFVTIGPSSNNNNVNSNKSNNNLQQPLVPEKKIAVVTPPSPPPSLPPPSSAKELQENILKKKKEKPTAITTAPPTKKKISTIKKNKPSPSPPPPLVPIIIPTARFENYKPVSKEEMSEIFDSEFGDEDDNNNSGNEADSK